MTFDISINIETMGLGQKACITEIGAVYFNRSEPFEIIDKLHLSVAITDGVENWGCQISPETVEWWALRDGGYFYKGAPIAVKAALDGLSYFLENKKFVYVWAKGPTFDLSVLERLYNKAEMPVPWKYNQPRDYRQLLDMAEFFGYTGPEFGDGPSHDGLADATDQARETCKIYDFLNKKKGDVSNKSLPLSLDECIAIAFKPKS